VSVITFCIEIINLNLDQQINMKEIIKDIREDISGVFDGNSKNNEKNKDNYKASPIPEILKKSERIAILTDNKVEDLEFFYPYYRFNEEGYKTDVITIKGGSFEGKHGLVLQDSKSIDEVNFKNYTVLYLPGGKAPQKLRENEKVLDFVRGFVSANKIIAAICHGPQILISAGAVRGKKVTAASEIKDELEKAGAIFVDEALQQDGQLITSRKPGDLHRHLYGVLKYLKDKNQKNLE